jgi:hypothetical protein
MPSLRTWLVGFVAAVAISSAGTGAAEATPTQVTPTPLPSATFNNPYSAQLYVLDEHGSFEQGTFAWDVEGGALPPGLSLTGSGVITGSPEQTGDFTFVVRASGPDGTIAATKAIHVDLVDPGVANSLGQQANQAVTQVNSLVGGANVGRVIGCLTLAELQSTLSTLLYGTPPRVC